MSGRVPQSTRGGVGRRLETRQLFARDRRLPDDAPLVFIEPGAAGRLRADCEAGHLICPVPDCRDPRLITRGGTRRDHFAHRHLVEASTHAPERWYHLCAKQLLGDWVRRHYPRARVQVDHEAVETARSRMCWWSSPAVDASPSRCSTRH